MVDDEVTMIEDHYVCDNCGADALSVKTIKHHDSCQPGECKKWVKFYSAFDS